jgi:NADH:ubiquinone oxidoreductase subunit 2 (subunit N)
MAFKTFFSFQNLFQFNSAFISPQEKLFAFAGVVMVFISIALKVAAVLSVSPIDKKYRNKFYHIFLTTGILELFWYFLRYENITFFGTKSVALLILLIGLVWLVFAITYTMKHYKKEKENWKKEMVRQKYLPV